MHFCKLEKEKYEQTEKKFGENIKKLFNKSDRKQRANWKIENWKILEKLK
jgi:hypothetical protein